MSLHRPSLRLTSGACILRVTRATGLAVSLLAAFGNMLLPIAMTLCFSPTGDGLSPTDQLVIWQTRPASASTQIDLTPVLIFQHHFMPRGDPYAPPGKVLMIPNYAYEILPSICIELSAIYLQSGTFPRRRDREVPSGAMKALVSLTANEVTSTTAVSDLLCSSTVKKINKNKNKKIKTASLHRWLGYV